MYGLIRDSESTPDLNAVTFEPCCLLDCFRIDSRTRTIALVGAGGKTTLMYRLAFELRARGQKVVTTTTTKIFPPRPEESPQLVVIDDKPDLTALRRELSEFGHITVTGPRTASGKLDSVSEENIREFLAVADCVIAEADGAAGRPIKAPEAWEPVVASFTDLVIPVVGLDAVGRAVTDDVVFRLARFLEVTGLAEGVTITAEAVGRLLAHPQGALKNVPSRAQIIPYLNKLDLLADRSVFQEISRVAIQESASRVGRMVAGSLKGRPETFILLSDG
ncbi:MAG: selenium cofactor biosynthesis protein YqeC [Thermodesulfobacteriota bacterium]